MASHFPPPENAGGGAAATASATVGGMARRKTTYYIDEGVFTATKMTAVATHCSESQLVVCH